MVKTYTEQKNNFKTLDNDIALLRIDPPLNPGGNIGIVCFPEGNEDPTDETVCYTAGWGRLGKA